MIQLKGLPFKKLKNTKIKKITNLIYSGHDQPFYKPTNQQSRGRISQNHVDDHVTLTAIIFFKILVAELTLLG